MSEVIVVSKVDTVVIVVGLNIVIRLVVESVTVVITVNGKDVLTVSVVTEVTCQGCQ